MASKSRKLRAAIKAHFEPAARDAGFVVDYPMFRRFDGDTVDLLEIQHWKDGGAFILNIARQVGPFEHPGMGPVPHDRLEIAHVSVSDRERLGPVKTMRMEKLVGWFKYDRIWDDRPALDALMQDVVALLPQMEAWLADGVRGPNIDPENSRLSDT